MSSSKQEVILASDTPAPAFSYADMNRMAVAIAKSGLFGVKDADQALSLMMIAQAEGKHPALIARDYDIIQGRPAKKSEAILRDFQASGGKVEWQEMTDKRAAALFSHPSSPKPVLIDWDLPRAKQAGLVGKPGGMYDKYPRQMLRARVISEGCRAIAPSATSGFYTPEEVRDFDATQPPATQSAAVEQASQAPDQDEIEGFINSMDVASLPALEAAFAAAWRSTKDAATRAKYKGAYDAMKVEIADAQARDLAEAEPLP
jgi:hypothetical protein